MKSFGWGGAGLRGHCGWDNDALVSKLVGKENCGLNSFAFVSKEEYVSYCPNVAIGLESC